MIKSGVTWSTVQSTPPGIPNEAEEEGKEEDDDNDDGDDDGELVAFAAAAEHAATAPTGSSSASLHARLKPIRFSVHVPHLYAASGR